MKKLTRDTDNEKKKNQNKQKQNKKPPTKNMGNSNQGIYKKKKEKYCIIHFGVRYNGRSL